MIILKIKKPGYVVNIPGIPTCRTPVEVDISKVDMRIVVMYLKSSDIPDYEIVATKKGRKEIYKKEDFEEKKQKNTKDPELIDRISRIEGVVATLAMKKDGNLDSEKEQITDRLGRIEKLLTQKISSPQRHTEIKEKDEIDKVESFIPDIDTSEMKIETKNLKSVKQESNDLDDVSDMLSSIIKKK